MNSFFQNATFFIRRYALVILVSICAGNLIAWLNGEENGRFYQSVIRVKCRADYYDSARSAFEKISRAITDTVTANSPFKESRIETYRNEEFYYTDLKLRFRDTAIAHEVTTRVAHAIRNEPELAAIYFDRLDQMALLIAELDSLTKQVAVQEGAGSKNALDDRAKLLQARVALEKLRIDHNELDLKLTFTMPDVSRFSIIRTGNSAGTYATASVLFLIIGLFIAVVLDRFRN